MTNSATAVAVSQTLVLRSTAFAQGGAMPGDYTCDGAGQSPGPVGLVAVVVGLGHGITFSDKSDLRRKGSVPVNGL